MRGDNVFLAVTTVEDEVTKEIRPLFGFPVQVASATADNDVKLDIVAPSGAPREQVYRDSATGEIVTDAECKRGVKVGDAFHEIPRQELEVIKEATSSKTILVLGHADLDSLPWDRRTGTHYLQAPPKGGSHNAYKLLYDGLLEVRSASGKTVIRPAQALVAKRTARSRQKLVAIYADPEKEALMMAELRFADGLKQPDDEILAPQQAHVDPAQVEKVRQVIDGLGDGLLALEAERDEAIPLKAELVEKAIAGEALEVPAGIAPAEQLADLDKLLEASIAQVVS
jgi:non-homologous end joining protein Ku